MKRASSAWGYFWGALPLTWQLLFFCLPLLCFLAAGSSEEMRPTLFLQPLYFGIIARSILLAASNALLCLAIGFPLAYVLATSRYRNLLLFLLLVPFWINFLLHVHAWFSIFAGAEWASALLCHLQIISAPLALLNSLFAIVVVLVYSYLPLMVLSLYSSLEGLDPHLIEAAANLGGSRWQIWRQILFPLSWPGLRSGFFLVYLPTFGEFAIPELMGGDKWMFVGNVAVHYLLGEGTRGYGIAFTLLSCAALFLSVWLFDCLLRCLFCPRHV